MIVRVSRGPSWKRKVLISLIFLSFSFGIFSSEFDSCLEWIKRKVLIKKKFTSEEFEILKHYLYELLKEGLYKEDIYAILNYFSQEPLEFKESITLLEEIIALLEVKSIPSKKLRNFISRKLKLGRINGKGSRELVLFLIEEIRKLKY